MTFKKLILKQYVQFLKCFVLLVYDNFAFNLMQNYISFPQFAMDAKLENLIPIFCFFHEKLNFYINWKKITWKNVLFSDFFYLVIILLEFLFIYVFLF